MSSKLKITKEGLKDIAVTVDSYRIRVLIDAKQEILNTGVYDEEQYDTILFKMFDEELIKYKLYNFLSRHKSNDFKALKKFSDENTVEISKTLSLLELLKNENLIAVNEIYDEIEGDENTPPLTTFKDFDIKSFDVHPSKIKSIYEPVETIFETIFETHNCSGCGLCVGICPVNCIEVFNGFGKIDDLKCIRCGLCYYICPRTYLPVNILNMVLEGTSQIKNYSKVGHYLEAYSARKSLNLVKTEELQALVCITYLMLKLLIWR